ncbi:hypothetical protein FACS18949_12940 [Clostridia bacterium]|nr:hypothetical protein FACS189425_04370 [Clostridia bacterium]GHV35288.1 hypothetical protein FACS18949_12940 [Clostridia bacterium]
MSNTVRELFENAKTSDLVDFIVDYAEHDSNFENALRVRLEEPEFNAEIDKISGRIDMAFRDVSDYSRRDSYGDVCIDTTNIEFEIRQRVKQGHIQLAFAESEVLYVKLLDILEYQGECEIDYEISLSLSRPYVGYCFKSV